MTARMRGVGGCCAGRLKRHPPKANLPAPGALPTEKLKELLPGIQAAILHHGHKLICSEEQRLQAFWGRTIMLYL